MSASILICDRPRLDRLLSEGELRRSFVHIAEQSLEATVGEATSESVDFDDALAANGLVFLDHLLVERAVALSSDQTADARFARNLIPKLARARTFWLEEIASRDASEQLESIQRVASRITAVAEAIPSDQCGLVLVATEPLGADARKAIDGIVNRQGSRVHRVYLLESMLQRDATAGRLVQASSVWPLYVARLLVACTHAPSDPHDRARRGVFAWRGFQVGAAEQHAVGGQFRAQIREQLLPTRPTDRPQQSKSGGGARVGVSPNQQAVGQTRPDPHGGSVSGARDVGENSEIDWSLDATELSKEFERLMSLDWFRSELKAKGQERKSIVAREQGTPQPVRNWTQVQEEWQKVAKAGRPKEADGTTEADGPTELRRMAEGETRSAWGCEGPSLRHEKQREKWAGLIEKRIEIRLRRDRLSEATAELVKARRHHLSWPWRLYIALALLLGIVQFYGALLEPLREASASAPAARAEFFGQPIEGSRIGFLIDRSVAVGAEEFALAKQKLAQAIAGLDSTREFSLGAYSDDVAIMPDCMRGPIRALDSNKAKALAWIEGLTLQGESRPTQALEDLVKLGLDRVAVISSGTIASDGIQRLQRFMESRSATVPPIDVVNLSIGGEPPLLRELAESTNGRFRRAMFDPFAPIGFWLTMLILVSLAALGAVLGLVLPWWLECKAGRDATNALLDECGALRGAYSNCGEVTKMMFQDAISNRDTSARHALGIQQQELAKRALAVLEQVLEQDTTSVSGTALGAGDRLRREDRNDVAQVLDVPVPAEFLPSAEVRAEVVESEAKKAADHLRGRWAKLCAEADPEYCGHLPAAAIRSLSDEIEKQEATLGASLVHGQSEGAGLDARLVEALKRRLKGPAGYPLLSVSVESKSGAYPVQDLIHVCVFDDSDEGVGLALQPRRLDLVARTHRPAIATRHLGLAGVALVVEQVELRLGNDARWEVSCESE
jgi:hypothetical protein